MISHKYEVILFVVVLMITWLQRNLLCVIFPLTVVLAYHLWYLKEISLVIQLPRSPMPSASLPATLLF